MAARKTGVAWFVTWVRSSTTARRCGHILILLVLLAGLPGPSAAEFRLDETESILVVLTHRAGFAARLAHNHLISASRYSLDARFDPENPVDTSMGLSINVDDLIVDDPALHEAWYPRFEALGILDEPLKEISKKDRRKIRRSMLGKSQLDAEAHSRIEARVLDVREQVGSFGDTIFPYLVTLELTIRGHTVARPFPGRYSLDGAILKIEAVGVFRFTDFGFKPYSAMLGAVRNHDEFHVFASLTLERVDPETHAPRRDEREMAE